MKNSKLVFLEEETTKSLFYPFTFTTKLENLRFGFLTIKTRWELFLADLNQNDSGKIFINPIFIPTKELIEKINLLKSKDVLYDTNNRIIVYLDEPINKKQCDFSVEFLENKTSLLLRNNTQFQSDTELLNSTFKEKHDLNDSHSKVYGNNDIFIGENVKLQSVIFNTEDGPIYIDDNVKILGNSVINGPCYIGKRTIIMPHTFLRNGVSCGENCVLAGEIKNTIIGNNSNKGHYGYLGDSIIGNFCNFGAGTTTSNLKNNFSTISIYNYNTKQLEKSSLNKCGIFMGDYTFTAVNTVFYAGTTINPINNIFENNTSQKFFAGGGWGNSTLKIEKLDAFLKNIMLAKNEILDSEKSLELHKLYHKLTTENA